MAVDLNNAPPVLHHPGQDVSHIACQDCFCVSIQHLHYILMVQPVIRALMHFSWASVFVAQSIDTNRLPVSGSVAMMDHSIIAGYSRALFLLSLVELLFLCLRPQGFASQQHSVHLPSILGARERSSTITTTQSLSSCAPICCGQSLGHSDCKQTWMFPIASQWVPWDVENR